MTQEELIVAEAVFEKLEKKIIIWRTRYASK